MKPVGLKIGPPLFSLALGVIWSCIMFQSVISGRDDVIWADGFDGNLIYWILEWGHHALVKASGPFDFWQANMFYPLDYSLATTESMLGAQLFYTPLRLLGIDVLPSIYVTSSLVMICGICCTDYLLRKNNITSKLERFLVVVIAHCGMFNTTMLYHYQLFGFQFAPGFLLAVMWYCNDSSRAALVWACFLYCLGSCYTTYLAPMLLVISLPILIFTLALSVKSFGWKSTQRRYASFQNCGIAMLFAGFLYLVQLRPYAIMAKKFPHAGWGESETYSANWNSFFTGISKYSLWYGQNVNYKMGDWERTHFLGYVLLCLAMFSVIGVVLQIFRQRNLHSFRDILVWLGVGVWIWSLSLGPYASGTKIRLPYRHLAELIPGLSSVRVPGRFGMLIGLPLAMLCIFGLRIIPSKFSRTIILTLAALSVFVESLPNFPSEKFRRQNWATYQEVAKLIRTDLALLEIPIARDDNYSTIMSAMDQMKGSTLHWARILSGYGAKRTPEFEAAIDLDRRAQAGEIGPEALVKFMHEKQFGFLLIHLENISPEYGQRWIRFIDEQAELQVIQKNKNYILLGSAT
jgi:hypothetical protein